MPITQGIETSSAEFVMPATDTGNLFFKNCTGCPLNSLRLTSSTRYVIGKLDVSRKELDRFLQKGGPYFVMIFRDVKEPTVVKIDVHADYRPIAR